MDKLKQVLKYQFWILLGLAVLFPLVGWFLASSGMAKNFEERQKKLDGQFSQLKASAADANSDWENQLKKINEVQEFEAMKARVQLWEMQQPLKVWPPKMSTTDPEQFTSADRGYYRKNYLSFRKEVFEQLEPVVEDEDEGRKKGKVAIALDSFPISEAVGGIRTDNPSSQEIEEAQEDLWLANAIIQVVRSLNQSSSSQVDAVIPEITVFNLRGGNRSGSTITLTKKSGGSSSSSSTSASAGSGGAAAMGEQMAKMAKEGLKASGFGGGMGGGGMGGGGASGDANTVGTVPTVTFDPIEELGEPGESPARRYVEDRDEFRTRGFYMELKIDQTRVPELLVLLSNLSWPARVTRVHVADVREEDLLPLGSSGGSGNAMAGGGGAMGGGMGMMGGGGGIDAMKAMSGAMAKMGGAGGAAGGAGVSGQAAGALLGSRVPGAPASSGGAAAGLTGGGLGGLTGAAGADTGSAPKVDPLANPNLVNVALDGWFTLYKKPKPEVLAKVYPPATPEPATSPGAAVPAEGNTASAEAAAGASAAGPNSVGTAANAAVNPNGANADGANPNGAVAGSPEPTAGAATPGDPATAEGGAASAAASPTATEPSAETPVTGEPAADGSAVDGAGEPANPPAENPGSAAPPAGTAPQ